MSYNNNRQWNKRDQIDYDWATGIISALIVISVLITFLSKPHISVMQGKIIISQGIIIPALIIGTMIWSLFEVFTRASKKAWNIILKVIIAFPIGLLLGGFLGYESNFGSLVITPAFNGNIYALFNLICIMIFEIILVATNVYYHHCTPIHRGR
jgi:hypothetical protein